MPQVKPELLVWARETAGFSVAEAAQKLGVKDASLAGYEAGKPLSRALLLKMAKQYRRPLVTFYMSAPPRQGDRGEDFRNLPEQQAGAVAMVDTLVRDIKARQAMVRAVLEDEEEEVERLPFVGSMRMEDGVGAVLASMRQTIGLDLAAFRAQASPEAAFAILRNLVEKAGIFVLLIGNLGSHHSALDVEAFRGFALADSIAPFIVINDQDAKAAWSFTLLHEAAHIWLGATGVSGSSTSKEIEKFCNDVASVFLLPAQELSLVDLDNADDLASMAQAITDFALERNLSRPLIAYRLFRGGMIDEVSWRSLRDLFQKEWHDGRERFREDRRNQAGGPDYYVVRRHRLGTALLRFVSRTMSEGVLSPTKAGKVLGVRPRNVAPLLSGLALSASHSV